MRVKARIVITDYQEFYRVGYLNIITGLTEMADFYIEDTPEEALSRAMIHASKYLGYLLTNGINAKIRFEDFNPKDIPLVAGVEEDYYEVAS